MTAKFAAYLKITVLTILTFGIYGAWWIFTNMMADTSDADLNDDERGARHAQNTFTVTWLNLFNRP